MVTSLMVGLTSANSWNEQLHVWNRVYSQLERHTEVLQKLWCSVYNP
jgi:hypothetical protein